MHEGKEVCSPLCHWGFGILNLLQCLDTILCLPRSLQCHLSQAGPAYLASASDCLGVTLAATSNRHCIFSHPSSSSVPRKSNASHCSGRPSAPSIDSLAASSLSTPLDDQGGLSRKAHRVSQRHLVLQVDLNVAVHQADMWQTVLSLWLSTCLTPLPLTSPSLERTVWQT